MNIKFELSVDIDQRSLMAFWDRLGVVLEELSAEYCQGQYEIKEISREE